MWDELAGNNKLDFDESCNCVANGIVRKHDRMLGYKTQIALCIRAMYRHKLSESIIS